MKKIIAFVLIVVTIVLSVVIDKGFQGLIWFWNAPSLLFLLLIDGSMLILSDHFPDFMRGIRIVSGNVDYTNKEMKSSLTAYNLLIKTTLTSGILGMLIGVVNMSGYDYVSYGVKLLYSAFGVAVLLLVYGLIMNIFFYAVRAKIQKEMIYRDI